MNANYDETFQKRLEEIRKSGKRPTLFLHACCGPCLCYPLSILLDDFDVTVGFINPNIRPLAEYEKRNRTLQFFLQRYVRDRGKNVSFVLVPEDFEGYDEKMKGREKDREGGAHCLLCHAYRISLSYRYAHDHGFDFFTTVMTVSCKKPSRELNEIAEKMAVLFPGTEYLYSDFKKRDGQLKGIRLSKEYNLYRQDYCGCLWSLQERKAYLKAKEEIIG